MSHETSKIFETNLAQGLGALYSVRANLLGAHAAIYIYLDRHKTCMCVCLPVSSCIQGSMNAGRHCHSPQLVRLRPALNGEPPPAACRGTAPGRGGARVAAGPPLGRRCTSRMPSDRRGSCVTKSCVTKPSGTETGIVSTAQSPPHRLSVVISLQSHTETARHCGATRFGFPPFRNFIGPVFIQ